MFKLLFAAVLFLPFSVQAETKILKSCRFEFGLNETVNVSLKGLNINGELYGVITARTVELLETSIKVMEYSEHSVRPGLTPEHGRSRLNLAEAVIVDSMKLTSPEQYAGLDLTQIRSAKVYLIGDHSQIAIVEASDEKGNLLGSFVTGPFIQPCQ